MRFGRVWGLGRGPRMPGKAKTMKKLISIIAAAAAAVGAAQAQEGGGLTNPNAQLANFDVGAVGPLLDELGLEWQAQLADNGQTYIAASVGGVVNFILAPTACRNPDGSDCVGLNMVAIFEGAANPQTVRAFNYRYAFASAGIDPTGAAYLSRYDLSDYGIARGNLATSIQVFVNQVVMFGAELDTAQRTVSLEGYADDLAASSLNRKGREALTGVEIHAANAIERHAQGLEDGAEAVKRFIRDGGAPRNKIRNLGE